MNPPESFAEKGFFAMTGWLKSLFKRLTKTSPAPKAPPVSEVLRQAAKSHDFHRFSPTDNDRRIQISYFRTLVDSDIVTRCFVPEIQRNLHAIRDSRDLFNVLSFADKKICHDASSLSRDLMKGYVLIQLDRSESEFLLVNVNNAEAGHRQTNETENEFSVVGPKIGFVENIEVNIHLLRQQIAVPSLVLEQLEIGNVSRTKVVIAYLEDVTNPRHVQTVRQRLSDIDFEVVFDSSLLDQIISDNSNTPFPLFLSTERVDRTTYAITSGQVAIMVDGSPYAVAGPAMMLDFFISPEDYFLPWIVGSFFRIIRIISVFFSIFASALYVAILTYHFELIPEHLLEPLIQSRAHVPFPPVMEVVFLEITIELLREAGARLPTKIGQTLGIVGGIVIGQASVEAALTSNILLIIVALSALASFTTPIFKMANTIRLLRFPFILLAALWGGLGIITGLFLLLGHLLRLKSLGVPYLAPLYPFRIGSFADSVVRSSYQYTNKRSPYLRPLNTKRYQPSDEKEDIRHE